MALNIGSGFIDRKAFGKTSRSENTNATSKANASSEGKLLTIGDLKPGHEFRATITDVNNNTMRLKLSDGQQITARLDAGGDFNIGEEITFTVKSNDGHQIDITPAKIPTEVNPTLLRALNAADMPVNPENLEMVRAMMDEQLPIDKSSLQTMHRQVLNNPGTPVQDLAQMTKFNIPITPENVTQFENYKNFENQISKELVKLSSELTNNLEDLTFAKLPEMGKGDGSSYPLESVVAQGENAAAVAENPEAALKDNGLGEMIKSLGIEASPEELEMLSKLDITGDSAAVEAALKQVAEGGAPEALDYNDMLLNIALETDAPAKEAASEERVAQTPGDPQQTVAGENVQAAKNAPVEENIQAGKNLAPEDSVQSGKNTPVQENGQKEPSQVPTLAEELTPAERNDLANALKQIKMPETLVNAVKEGNITDKELLKEIKDKFDNDKGSLKQLFDQAILSDKNYKKVLSNAISKQWFLKPAEVGEDQKVSNLYEKLNRQMKMVAEQTANLNTAGKNNIMQLATNTSSNMDFMNHVNQQYAYVQIPVHINGEDKQSDLYVFSNKKNLSDKEGEIKALLHLDMDALGAVDAFMKLKDTKLDTKFTLDNDLSYKLFEDHISELTTRLEAKGYNCKITFDMGNEPIDFVEDFMKQGQNAGVSQRLSFDVRA